MDEADRKRLAELNAEADKKVDRILGVMLASQWTPWIIVAWTLLAVGFGMWLKG